MVVTPMPNVPSHVVERLLGQDLAVMPSPDLHRWRLVSNLLDLSNVAAPARKESVCILAQAK